jgi:hypothetical protein
MNCANCDCLLGRDIFGIDIGIKEYHCCSKSCQKAKMKEIAELECNKYINLLKEDIEKTKQEIEWGEDNLELFDELKQEDEYKRGQEIIYHAKKKLKLYQFSMIILISIRDRKGTYPLLKIKYSEFIDDFMSEQATSDRVCEIATFMTSSYKKYEMVYNILKN